MGRAALPPQQWKGEVGDVVDTMQSLRQRWSNDEMRATDERKGSGGSQTVRTERSSKQRAGHLITERVLLHACHRLTGSPLSPLDCACTERCSQGALGCQLASWTVLRVGVLWRF